MKKKVLSLVLIAMLAVSSLVCSTATLAASADRYSFDFEEGFELGKRQADGSIAWQGGENSELGTYSVENGTLKCVKSGTGGNVPMNFDGNVNFNTDNKILSLEFKIKFENTTAGQVVYWHAFGHQYYFELYASGSNVNMGGSMGNTGLSCHSWRKVRVDAYNTDTGSNFDFYVDDVYRKTVSKTSPVPTSANFLTIYGAGSCVFTYYMDDLKVREYTVANYKEPYSTDCGEGFGFNKDVNGVKIVPETNQSYGMWSLENETVKITKTTGGGSNYMNVYASEVPADFKSVSVAFDVCFDVANADHPLYWYALNSPQGWFNFGGSPLVAVLNFSGKSGNTISGFGFPTGEWHNVRIAANTDGTNTYYSFYKDGVLNETVTVSGDKLSSITSSTYLFRIGGASGAITTARFDNFNIDFPANVGTVSGYDVKYMKGEEEVTEFAALNPGDVITPVATVSSATNGSEIDFITVFYTSDDEMISVNFQTLKASTDGAYTLNAKEIPEGAQKCKVMLWTDEILPLATVSVLD